MTVRVFAPPGPWQVGQRMPLTPDESHYLVRVRRARPGDTVQLLDGRSACWDTVLLAVGGGTAMLELRRLRPDRVMMPLQLVLVVPEPRATLEALTHASELAATEAVLVVGERSPAGLPSEDRIARTLRAAQRQCGRPRPLRVRGPVALSEALHDPDGRPGWVGRVPEAPLPPHDRPATEDPPDAPPRTPPHVAPDGRMQVDPHTGARLLIGPEGGLSPAEEALADAAGLRPLGLGPWVLRTATAVSAGLACLLGTSGRDAVDP